MYHRSKKARVADPKLFIEAKGHTRSAAVLHMLRSYAHPRIRSTTMHIEALRHITAAIAT